MEREAWRRREGLDEGRRREEKKNRRMEEEGSEGKAKGRFCHHREVKGQKPVCDIFEPKSTAQSNIPFFLHVCLLWLWIHCCL